MIEAKFHAKPYADMLRKVFDLPGTGMTRPLAESILALDFPDEEEARIEELSGKANEGLLTAEEEAELEASILPTCWPTGNPKHVKVWIVAPE